MSRSDAVASDRRTTVLDLHGLLAIALVDAGPSDTKAIARQLGPLPLIDAADRDPDITIRFVDRVDVQGSLRLLGREAAYGDDEFLVLRGRRKTTVRVKIPVADIGTTPLEIVAERGLSNVPFLLPIIMLTLLSNGTVPVHASAFVAAGRGTLVTGWAKGGKSEALLAFADHGATYVGDEWVFVTADGAAMAGLPEPMRLWDWQLAMVPRLGRRIGFGRRVRLGMAASTSRLLAGVARLPLIRSSAPGDLARRVGAMAENQRSLQIPPERVFDGRVSVGLTPLDTVVLIESSTDPVAAAEPVDGTIVARRTAATVVHELLDISALYLTYRYAFPDRRNPMLEALPAVLEEALVKALGTRRCVVVRHPYPPDIPALHGLIEGAIAASAAISA
jgi:hypothetical protein